MDKLLVRAEFEDAIGREEYVKFLTALHSACLAKRCLFFWQERLWDRFREGRDMAPMPFEEIVALFSYCHIHGAEFEADVVPIKYGTYRPATPEQVARKASLYPYANECVYGPCWDGDGHRQEVFFCPQCREALARQHVD